MHISSIHIKNFRCFYDTRIEFQHGLNVIIGENNSGKTALFRALRLVLDRGAVQLSVHDIHQAALRAAEPPLVEVSLQFHVAETDAPEDKAAVAGWLTHFEFPWKAQLSFVFELPSEHHERYKTARDESDGNELEKSTHAFELLQEDGRFVGQHFGGELKNRYPADAELRRHFECRYLDAIRDAESDLQSGRSELLRKMLRRVLDRQPESDTTRQRRKDFRSNSSALIDNLKGRLDYSQLFSLAGDVWGSGMRAEPDLFGRLSEIDVLQALVLFLNHGTHLDPVSHNGLGYNNLLYVALVLASLGITTPKSSTAEFPVLLIEEPEAHLHPALQYRFLHFLREQLQPDPQTGCQSSRQVFLSSHSTQVTAAVGLDSLICLYLDNNNVPRAAYPGRTFSKTQEGRVSKAYVERFLDATKSSMLFARGVLLVEGIAEQVLIPDLADLAFGGRQAWLDRNFVALVRVDGLTFKHFLPLFGLTEDAECAALGLSTRKVACLIDGDPRLAPTTAEGGKPKKCWPYEEPSRIILSPTAKYLQTLASKFGGRLEVSVATKTFEYDLVLANPEATLLITEVAGIEAGKALRQLMEGADHFGEPWRTNFPSVITAIEGYRARGATEADLRKHALASYMLLSHEGRKGEHASLLVAGLAEQLLVPQAKRVRFILPPYLEKALRHVCSLEPPPESDS